MQDGNGRTPDNPTRGNQPVAPTVSDAHGELQSQLDKAGSTTRPLPLGAPLAPPPVRFGSSRAVSDVVGTGVGSNGVGISTDQVARDEESIAPPMSRRSLARPDLERGQIRTVVQDTDRTLAVVDGDELGTDPAARRNLSPRTAAAIGDFAAAMAGPLVAGIAVGSAWVFVATALLVLIVGGQARRSGLTEREISAVSPIVAAVTVFVLTLIVERAAIEAVALTTGLTLIAGTIAALLINLMCERLVRTRVAVIGDAGDAHELAWRLASSGVRRYEIVGHVSRDSSKDNLRELRHISFKVRRLGQLSELSHIVARHDVDLLVLADGADRLAAFERAAVCTERYRTRLVGMLAFDEAVFQRVPVEQLNISWMQHVMHPRFRPAPTLTTRILDVIGAGLLAIISMAIWLPTAVLLKVTSRGPLLQRNRRVGERGRSFSVLKFRTAIEPEAAAHDVDSTTIDPSELPADGRLRSLIRRSRIDRLPILINVLRGDLSLVGPRPARPRDVSRLEQDLPFYGRRHLLKPGVTGWAQLRGNRDDTIDEDERFKDALACDLFYLKHQSLFLYGYVLVASCVVMLKRALHLD